MKPIFVTGIDTNVGKTIASAILVEALRADYWKPIQAGSLELTDTRIVQGLVSNEESIFHPESYTLTQPYSPHKSADMDGVSIDPAEIRFPDATRMLVIEGAGGLMVPLNPSFLIVDLIEMLDAEIVLVSKHCLGSINHTLLSCELLKIRGLPVKGLIFNGAPDTYTEEVIMQYTGLPCLLHIEPEHLINKETIQKYAKQLSVTDFV